MKKTLLGFLAVAVLAITASVAIPQTAGTSSLRNTLLNLFCPACNPPSNENLRDLTSSVVTLRDAQTVTGATTFSRATITTPLLTIQPLLDTATVSWDLDQGAFGTLTVATSGRSIGATTNLRAGTSATLLITYSGTGTVTSFDSSFKWPSGTAPTLTNSNGKSDLIRCRSNTSTALLCDSVLDVR